MQNEAQLITRIEKTAEEKEFSGVISLVEKGKPIFEKAYGDADKSQRINNQLNTRFGIASGTKTFTALAIGKLIQEGKLSFSSKAVACTEIALPNISPDVTIKQLLTHISGIADYYDEEEVEDPEAFFVEIPWYQLAGPKDYLPLFINEPMKFEPGTRFSYSNGGYILLGIILEEITGVAYQRYVEENLFAPCRMTDSGFFAMNALPERTAYGYINTENGWTTNIYNLPIIGASDGGAFTTVDDLKRFWHSLFAYKILNKELLDIFLQPYQCVGSPDKHKYYGHGFWMYQKPEQELVYYLQGWDAGVSFQSQIILSQDVIVTILSNTTEGVWSIVQVIKSHGWYS